MLYVWYKSIEILREIALENKERKKEKVESCFTRTACIQDVCVQVQNSAAGP